MAREVDRLLAQLTRVDTRPSGDRIAADGEAQAPRTGGRPRPAGAAPPTGSPTRGDRLALWARVLLGMLLGGVMTQWPYPRECGLPLVGYLSAVATVFLAGAWVAFASWKLRSGPAHILSLILLFWGIVLAAEQVLPRIGYAVDRASWRCAPALSVGNPVTSSRFPWLWPATS